MITLNTTLDLLQIITGVSGSTDYSATFADMPGTTLEANQTADGNITAAATNTLVGSPPPRTARKIHSVQVRNRHGSDSQTVTLVKSVNGTAYRLTPAVTLFSGEALSFTRESGLTVYTANGREKIANGSFTAPQFMTNPAFQTNDITGTTLAGTGWCMASYVGKAPRNLEWATVRLRVTTAVSAGASEWCQVALAKGDVNVGGNPTLTVVGFTSAEGTLNSTGLKSIVVSVGANYAINEGDNIWAIAGCSAPVVLRIRAGLADDVQGGTFALVSSQPSAIIGVATAFTILGATVSAPWLSVVT